MPHLTYQFAFQIPLTLRIQTDSATSQSEGGGTISLCMGRQLLPRFDPGTALSLKSLTRPSICTYALVFLVATLVCPNEGLIFNFRRPVLGTFGFYSRPPHITFLLQLEHYSNYNFSILDIVTHYPHIKYQRQSWPSFGDWTFMTCNGANSRDPTCSIKFTICEKRR